MKVYSRIIHFSLEGSLCMLSCLSHVQLFATLWTMAHQAPLSMGFSKQEYWNGLPCSPPGHLSHLGIEPTSLLSPALAGRFLTLAPPGKPWRLLRDSEMKLRPEMMSKSKEKSVGRGAHVERDTEDFKEKIEGIWNGNKIRWLPWVKRVTDEHA